MTSNKTTNINKQNWLQFLFVVKATALKQANMKNLSANSKHGSLLLHICQATDWYKCGSWLLCLEFADKIAIFAVLN